MCTVLGVSVFFKHIFLPYDIFYQQMTKQRMCVVLCANSEACKSFNVLML